MGNDNPDVVALYDVLAALGATPNRTAQMSKLAAQVRRRSLYSHAYAAIGRLVAAGYAEYVGTPPTDGSEGRVVVRMTAAGHKRLLLGRDWVHQAVTRAGTASAVVSGLVRVSPVPDHASPGTTP